MNAMTLALATAGVAVPTVKERIWRVIKEQPGLTARQISRLMPAVAAGTISSQLFLLEKAELIYVKGTKGQGPRGTTKAYYTDHDKFVKPERWPHNGSTKGNGTNPAPLIAYAPPAPAPAPAPKTRIDVDSLTLAEARTLYNQLKEFFG